MVESPVLSGTSILPLSYLGGGGAESQKRNWKEHNAQRMGIGMKEGSVTKSAWHSCRQPMPTLGSSPSPLAPTLRNSMLYSGLYVYSLGVNMHTDIFKGKI